MNDLIVFGGIVVLFFGWLLVKSLTKSHGLCAICASTTTTWLGLLGLRFLGLYENDILLAVLLGASATGGYYWLGKSGNFALYKLPIFLSLIVGAYLIAWWQVSWTLILLISVVWILFWIFSFGAKNKGLLKKIIECCKNW
ncbi:MAG: hypothetical protein COU10_01070 [Candidatus Harrisonbacteria bacterium CG10_big_fil_rev_8_21_14_0_10_45_28]|uniref:Uncharacterized protein n=1 Tax=Candidatus Harrisonbacteria bacterium CG10_big_fil_rev_8_21_14_0_10_45_28 TaxID=1974586 RepID=A0A2H0UNS3_9BACT|nr:MAG: hypothetical protein COU10_01070 [Candidatus Harrisonbacteria bacterium CG10_big_fil_rev_8_21_14_0_10_45_28]